MSHFGAKLFVVILQLIKLQIILQLENTVNWLKNGVMTLNVSDTPVVPFSNLLAIVFFKKRNSLKNHERGVTGVFYVVE